MLVRIGMVMLLIGGLSAQEGERARSARPPPGTALDQLADGLDAVAN